MIFLLNIFLNVLFRWQKSKKVQVLNSNIISRAIEYNLLHVTKAFAAESLASKHTISKILDELNVLDLENNQTYNPPIEVILNLTTATVSYFFACCHETGNME